MVHGMGLLGPLFAFLTSTSNMPGGFMDRSVYLWPWDIRVYICHWRWGAECTMLFANQKAGDPSGLVWEVIMTTQLDLWSRCYDGAKGLRQWCAQEMPIQLQWVWESQLGLTIVYRRYRLVCILLESSQIPVRSGSAKWQSLVDVPKDSSNVRSELHVVSLKMICQINERFETLLYIHIHRSYYTPILLESFGTRDRNADTWQGSNTIPLWVLLQLNSTSCPQLHLGCRFSESIQQCSLTHCAFQRAHRSWAIHFCGLARSSCFLLPLCGLLEVQQQLLDSDQSSQKKTKKNI